MAQSDKLSPTYRFITTDLLTNTILAEIPFTGVSYELALNDAGRFRGDVFVNSETKKLDLFNSTMPGKTGLYILRNNECVWGGMIWSREYSVNNQSLGVEASEFTSYLHHRAIWKTFQTTFTGQLKVEETPGLPSVISLPTGAPFPIKESDVIRLIFRDPYTALNSYFSVLRDSDSETIYISAGNRFYRLTQYQVVAVKADQTVSTVRLWTQEKHGLAVGESFNLSSTGIDRLNGGHTVLVVNSEYSVTVNVSIGNSTRGLNKVRKAVSAPPKAKLTVSGSVPPGIYDVSVLIKATVYEFVKGLIDATMADFTLVEFPNTAIEAGETSSFSVTSVKAAGGIVTLTTNSPHQLAESQRVTVKNVDYRVNGEFKVLEVIDEYTFTYECATNPIVYTPLSVKKYRLKSRRTLDLVTTYVTASSAFADVAHDFDVGDLVEIVGIPDVSVKAGRKTKTYSYNGKFVITSVPSRTSFTHSTQVEHDDNIIYSTMQKPPEAFAIAYPTVLVGSYGPYPQFSDIGITFDESDRELFDVDISAQQVRGFKLETVGDYLDTFSSASAGGIGFEYRIECRYDGDTNQFSRVFRLVPLVSGAELVYSDDVLAYLGADKIIFEFPGNISDFSLSETAEDSVTRMFVVGNREGLSEDASQPYSASVSDSLTLGWPLLDGNESENDLDSEDLLASLAKKYADESNPPITDFSLTINGSLDPVIGSYSPGQWCSIIVDDEYVRLKLASDLEPRDDRLIRKIQSIEVSIPDTSTFPEEVRLDLVSEAEVSRNA